MGVDFCARAVGLQQRQVEMTVILPIIETVPFELHGPLQNDDVAFLLVQPLRSVITVVILIVVHSEAGTKIKT